MVQAVINIISNSFFTGLAIIGTGTLINKIGSFINKYESEKEDAYKKAFDDLMIHSVEEFNFCIDSLKKIIKSGGRGTYLMMDVMMGNKVVQKDKNGKIIISDKSKLYNNYQDTISELNEKVKEYQEELQRIKKIKENKKIQMNIKKKYDDEDNSTINTYESDDENTVSLNKKLKNDFAIQSSDNEEDEENNESDEEFIIQKK